MAPRTILHVDLDAFFVAVERLRDPSLIGRPVVVGADPQGGRGRGVVAAASYEARAFGLRSAMPIGEAYRRCPHAVFLPGRHDLYARAARAVRRACRRFTPAVEPVSIDEAYLDLSGTERLHGAPAGTVDRIRTAIASETGLPVSMGLATTRVVAKIASDLAKPAGFLHVWPGREAAFLAPLPIERMPGIGPATRARLSEFNLRTLGDLARLDPALLGDLLGAWGPSLLADARGEDPARGAAPVRPGRERPKSVSRECTFDEDTDDPAFCEGVLFSLSERACHDLRAHRLTARTVALKLRYRDFTTVTRRATLATPTDSDRTVAATARELFRAAYARRVRVRLLGVALANLVGAAPQLDLFADPRALAWERLLGPLDRLRGRYGFGVVRTGPTLGLERAAD
ncbi:MAG TPA: DNA polymerase IV [Gemmatimonadota bacterium]|nr:DNA polymerase IV [Gemmatimonadota bacterium]